MDTFFLALRVLLSLAVVLGLLWMVQRRLTRSGRTKSLANPIVIVGRQSVGDKATVVVLDLDGTRFLLGVTEQSVNVLHSDAAPAPEAVDVPDSAQTFAEVLADTTREHGPVAPLPPRSRRSVRPKPALAGSILSPSTWRQTVSALRSEP